MSKNSSKSNNEIRRPPVVAVVGHVDHGKTTLLDFIRKTNVGKSEARGITQRLGAYEVEIEISGQKRKITFLDTPGHEAFAAMRKFGSKVADLAILVVAADDGVKPQTIEARKMISSANIPYVVAINKIDRPEANIDRTKQTLAENEIYVEGYGGNVPSVAVSATTGEGVPELLEIIALTGDMVDELKTNPEATASGVVLQSSKDSRRGNAATLLVKNGKLSRNDFVIAGETIARARVIEGDTGGELDAAGASTPVKIYGFDKAPEAGTAFTTAKTKPLAEDIARQNKDASKRTVAEAKNDGEAALFPIIVKSAVSGIREAILYEIEKLNIEAVRVKILHSGVGNISENDVKTAMGAKGAVIVGFDTDIDRTAKALAERSGIVVKTFNLIYELTKWLAEEIRKRVVKKTVEKVVGTARVIKIFSSVKDKYIVGGKVEDGVIAEKLVVQIVRRGNQIGNAVIKELQQAKKRASKVEKGNEFGAQIESKIEIAQSDLLQAIDLVIEEAPAHNA